MKRYTAIFLAGLMALTLAACSTQGASSGSQGDPTSSNPQQDTGLDTSEQDASDAQPGADAGQEDPRMLVAYFSYGGNAALPDGVDASASASIQIWNGTTTGNTGAVASMIAQATGGDLFSIRTVEPYPSSYDETVDQGQAERSANARPALATHLENLADYDVIFLGYPNWWGDMPMAIYSFLDQVDLSGKTIVPFVTSGGSGFSNTVRTIQDLEPGATVAEGLSLRDSSTTGAQEQVDQWLQALGYGG